MLIVEIAKIKASRKNDNNIVVINLRFYQEMGDGPWSSGEAGDRGLSPVGSEATFISGKSPSLPSCINGYLLCIHHVRVRCGTDAMIRWVFFCQTAKSYFYIDPH